MNLFARYFVSINFKQIPFELIRWSFFLIVDWILIQSSSGNSITSKNASIKFILIRWYMGNCRCIQENMVEKIGKCRTLPPHCDLHPTAGRNHRCASHWTSKWQASPRNAKWRTASEYGCAAPIWEPLGTWPDWPHARDARVGDSTSRPPSTPPPSIHSRPPTLLWFGFH